MIIGGPPRTICQSPGKKSHQWLRKTAASFVKSATAGYVVAQIWSHISISACCLWPITWRPQPVMRRQCAAIQCRCSIAAMAHCRSSQLLLIRVKCFRITPVAPQSARRLAESLGMAVFDVQEEDIHGGTFRAIIGKEGSHDVLPLVAEFVANEKAGG
jgi:hypothetical protein